MALRFIKNLVQRIKGWQRGLVVLCCIFFLVVILSWKVLDKIHNETKNNIEYALQVVLESTHKSIILWIHDRVDDAVLIAARPDIIQLTKELLENKVNGQDLAKVAAQGRLRGIVRDYLVHHRDAGMFLIAPDGINIGSMRDENLSLVNLLYQKGNYLPNVFMGKSQVVLPIRSDVPLPDRKGVPMADAPTMFVVVPVIENNVVLAAFAVRIDPSDEFTAIAMVAHFKDADESYIFNDKGMVISEVRFESQLRAVGLLSDRERAILSLKLKNPGGDLLSGYQPEIDSENWALTKMAQRALVGEPGVDVDGYRDFRGVMVVGSWLWNSEYRFGLTYEIEKGEAYSSYYSIRRVIVLALIFICCASIVISAVLIRRERQVLGVNEQLRKEIVERRKSEEQFRAVTDAVHEAIIVISGHDKILYWNKSAERVFGYTCDEMIGKKLHNYIVTEQVRDKAYPEMEGFRETGQGGVIGKTRQVSTFRRDGTHFPAELSVTSIKSDGVWFAVGLIRDISAKVQAESTLKMSEALLKEAQELAHIGHWQLIHQSNEMIWSDELYRIFGYTKEAFSVNLDNFVNALHPDEREEVMSSFADAVGNKRGYELTHRIVRPNGEVRWILEICETSYDEIGKPVRSLGTVQDITEQKEAQLALLDSEQRFGLAVESSNIGVWNWDVRNKSISWDDRTNAMLGLPYDTKHHCKKFLANIHSLDRKRMIGELRKAIKGEGLFSSDFRVITSDGSIRYLSSQGTVIFDKANHPLKISGVILDISERKKNENKILELNQRLEERVKLRTHELVSSIKELHFLYKASELMARPVTSPIEDLTEIVNLLPYSWLYPEIACSRIKVLDMVVQTPNWLSTKWRQWVDVERDGKRIGGVEVCYLESRPEMYEGPFRQEERHLLNNLAKQISAYIFRVQAQDALMKKEEDLRAIVEGASGDFIFYITNEYGMFKYVSPSVFDILGYSQEEFIEHYDDLLTLNPINEVGRENIKKALRGEKPPVHEMEIQGKDGELHIMEVSGLPKFNSSNRVIGVHGISRDITESHRVRLEIMLARDAAEAADQAKSNFLANISHELRTPLNALVVGTYLLQEGELSIQQADYINDLVQATARLKDLINDILDFSKIEAGKMVLNPVGFVLRDFLTSLRERVVFKCSEKGLVYRDELADELPEQLIGDHFRLSRILDNLIDNAIKFTETGEVVLGVEVVSHNVSVCRLHFVVRDTGIGMNEDEVGRLFDSFCQLDGSSTRKYDGLGLGLSVCKRIVELMGGEIKVESEPEIGTVVSFDLDFEVVSGPRLIAAKKKVIAKDKSV
ncbi:MAG: PAS domain S-box protein, partial [Desulfobulbaceae bacterium]|nr:PAS domain S-box protein [Desulfobulbaceae bacterium]